MYIRRDISAIGAYPLPQAAEGKFSPIKLRGRPSCRSSPLSKQSTGLFRNSPLAERRRLGLSPSAFRSKK